MRDFHKQIGVIWFPGELIAKLGNFYELWKEENSFMPGRVGIIADKRTFPWKNCFGI